MNGFNLSNISDLYVGSTQALAAYYGSTLIWSAGPHDYSLDYLTIKNVSNYNNSIIFDCTYTISILYSTDLSTWTEVIADQGSVAITTLAPGGKVYLKGENAVYATSTYKYCSLYSSYNVDVYGNILSLVYGDDFADYTDLSNALSSSYNFYKFFMNQKVVDASNLILPTNCTTSYCYSSMFYGCTSLTSAPALPATTLTSNCYDSMFYGCTSLTSAPALPATTLVNQCYRRMFYNCSSLNYIKAMFTTTPGYDPNTGDYYTQHWVDGVAEYGTFTKNPNATWEYRGIDGVPVKWEYTDNIHKYFTIESLSDNNTISFLSNSANETKTIYCETITSQSTSLWVSKTSSTEGTVLTTLNTGDRLLIKSNGSTGTSSNINHFISTGNFKVSGNIMSLIYGDSFWGNTTLSDASAFRGLFGNCTYLTDASGLVLPATTLTEFCCQYMFYGCSSLTSAPELPATTLADSCYQYMFYNCSSLTTAPELPATTLTFNCYHSMFYGCSSLTSAPELPATTLVYRCYHKMFTNCTSLNYIKAMFTTTPGTDYTGNWVGGVSSTGTFVKDFNLKSIPINSTSGIPEGWTIEEVNVPDFSQEYFTIESLEDNNEIQFIKGSNAPTKTIEWSTDGTTWTSSTSSTTPTVVTTLNTGDKIMIRGNNTQYASSESVLYSNRLISTKTINMYGNIMSLLYGDNFVGQTTLPANYTFLYLFWQGNIVDASNLILPATTLTDYCYRNMFYQNSSLTAAPELPATTLTAYCYSAMFQGCTSLTTPPAMSATTVASSCCASMFRDDAALTTAPYLLATTLASRCYYYMFRNCTSLQYIKCLATNISASGCTNFMTSNVAATGTFVKDANMTSWTTGQNGIPSRWTVIDA